MATRTLKDAEGNNFNVNGHEDAVGNFTPYQISGANKLALDAWGRQKNVLDHSLFHGLWTYDVPKSKWIEKHGTGGDIATLTEQPTFTQATSSHGMLQLTSGANSGDIKVLTSKRHPRYQPNRGHLYSTALHIIDPTALGSAAFGLQNKNNGVFFFYSGDGANWTLSAVVRRDNAIADIIDITSALPVGFDPTKGHVYDIQMEWRGVGSFELFVDLQSVNLFDYLGKLDFLSTTNPALPVTYAVTNNGGDYGLRVGCVDVTSEGGKAEHRTYSSSTTGNTLLNVAGGTVTAVQAYHIPELFGADEFTRDSILTRLTTFCKDEAVHGLWISRSIYAPNMEALTWLDCEDSLNQEIVDGGTGSALAVAFAADIAGFEQVYAARQEKDFVKVTDSPSDNSDFVLSAGDMLVVTFRSDGASFGGATIEVDVEI